MRILFVEDDKSIARFVRKGLRENYMAVDVAYDGEEGMFLALHEAYDLLILDIMLPKIDGIEILKSLRETGKDTPVIFLTAKDRERDIVKGLNLGADDYMVKPFSINELLARVRAVLRRMKAEGGSRLTVADLTMDPATHRVSRGGKRIDLTPKEYALLEYLMRNRGEIVTRTMISESVWDYHYDCLTNVIDVHVYHLRNKIDKGFEPKLLHTIKGVGYVLEARG
ncbi:MAG: heavy metal response regulator transcription factor [Deltaproteobacteria bacterium]|nr:heavy metal response regulator transcription factor [Deltaproteobacteria bacterium]